jgi:His/Glu/Gln/Arg/opine family amino acid ABC transporter permease subunit
MDLDFAFVLDNLDVLLRAAPISLLVAVAGFAVALVIAAVMTSLRTGPWAPGRWLSFVYVNFFRGAALYVLVVWLYNGIAVAANILIPAITVGVLTLALLNSAYLAEVFRSGLAAVDAGQREAAEALGLSPWDTFRRVLAPQVLRVVLPPVGNHFIDALKDTAILAVIAVPELMFATTRLAQSSFRPFEFYLTAAAIYLVMVYAISLGLRALERRVDPERRYVEPDLRQVAEAH